VAAVEEMLTTKSTARKARLLMIQIEGDELRVGKEGERERES
jgi:hypothetical protein